MVGVDAGRAAASVLPALGHALGPQWHLDDDAWRGRCHIAQACPILETARRFERL